MSGVIGFSSGPTAFTNAPRPDSVTTRVAQPGDIPPTCSSTPTTSEPSVAATHERTRKGMSE